MPLVEKQRVQHTNQNYSPPREMIDMRHIRLFSERSRSLRANDGSRGLYSRQKKDEEFLQL